MHRHTGIRRIGITAVVGYTVTIDISSGGISGVIRIGVVGDFLCVGITITVTVICLPGGVGCYITGVSGTLHRHTGIRRIGICSPNQAITIGVSISYIRHRHCNGLCGTQGATVTDLHLSVINIIRTCVGRGFKVRRSVKGDDACATVNTEQGIICAATGQAIHQPATFIVIIISTVHIQHRTRAVFSESSRIGRADNRGSVFGYICNRHCNGLCGTQGATVTDLHLSVINIIRTCVGRGFKVRRSVKGDDACATVNTEQGIICAATGQAIHQPATFIVIIISTVHIQHRTRAVFSESSRIGRSDNRRCISYLNARRSGITHTIISIQTDFIGHTVSTWCCARRDTNGAIRVNSYTGQAAIV